MFKGLSDQGSGSRAPLCKGKSDPAAALTGHTQTSEQGSRHHSGFGKQKSLLLSLSTVQHSQLLYRHSQPIFSTQQRQTLTCAGLTLHISVPLSIHGLQAPCLQASAELPNFAVSLKTIPRVTKLETPGTDSHSGCSKNTANRWQIQEPNQALRTERL